MINKLVLNFLSFWDNVEKYGRARETIDENITRRMRTACWITKAKDTP
jgi:hypothetical protein